MQLQLAVKTHENQKFFEHPERKRDFFAVWQVIEQCLDVPEGSRGANDIIEADFSSSNFVFCQWRK